MINTVVSVNSSDTDATIGVSLTSRFINFSLNLLALISLANADFIEASASGRGWRKQRLGSSPVRQLVIPGHQLPAHQSHRPAAGHMVIPEDSLR
jgi:hypothetical protein